MQNRHAYEPDDRGAMTTEPKVRIGCPVWAHAPWVGRFFTAAARREDYLAQYASVFGSAEGNATFYGLPSAETVRKWMGEAPAHFRFCFKFPRVISHDLRLVGAEFETGRFFHRLAPLGERLGPFFLQLHESFGWRELPVLEKFLRNLPREFRYALEVRSPEFFDGAGQEQVLDGLLSELAVDRVIFDTRGLMASTATDEATLNAKRRKPRTPVRLTATGKHPFVRFVGDPAVDKNTAALAAWAEVVARWIGEGRSPYFFAHHPDDAHAPQLGRNFQRLLRARCAAVPPPPQWPCEKDPAPEQLGLF